MLGIYRRFLDSTAPGGISNSISGSFDIRGDCVAGVVALVPCASNAGLRVDAVRRGQTIASCVPIKKRGERRLRFVMPIEGRFSPEEILYETVTLIARTDRGDTGVIKMEGAARFELTRMVLGGKIETLFDLDFTRQGNACPNLGKGWSVSEPDFTCTLDDNSFIHFQSPAAFGTYMLRMRFSPFIWKTLPIQTLDAYVNETQVDEYSTSAEGIVFHQGSFDGAVFHATAKSTIRLHHPNAGRFSEHYETTDSRRMAFAFRRISLVRVVSPLM